MEQISKTEKGDLKNFVNNLYKRSRQDEIFRSLNKEELHDVYSKIHWICCDIEKIIRFEEYNEKIH